MKKIFFTVIILNLISCTLLKDAVGTYGLNVTRNVIKTINLISPEKDKKIEYIAKFTDYVDSFWKKDSNINHEIFKYDEVKMERLYQKDKKNKSAIYIVHGGAFLVPLVNAYRSLGQYMIKQDSNFDIIFVDYKKLPDYTYPAGNNDVDKGLKWCFENYENVYAMGDSSGGNLILSTLLKRRDEKRKMPKALVLISPFLDMEAIVDSRIRNKNNDLLIGGEYNKHYETKYLIDSPYYKGYDKSEPYISPIFAKFHNFIPTYIEVNKDEMLYDDSYIIYNKMKKENIDVELFETEKLFHVHHLLIYTNEAKKSVNKIMKFFQMHEK